jgi:glucokinase
MILVADVGGTKTLVQAGTLQAGRWRPQLSRRYRNGDYAQLGAILRAFLGELEAGAGRSARIEHACLAVAGPVSGQYAELTNRPWRIDAAALAREFGMAEVRLVNDFEAAAMGIDGLEPEAIVTLQAGAPLAGAPRAVIGAGTGLGVAYAVRCGEQYRPVGGEGGHMAFGPATPEQAALWRHLFDGAGRVTGEDVVSGPGLARIHAFVRERARLPTAQSPLDPEVIAQLALDRADRSCIDALKLFIACYGAIAGDHALAVNARGGVYLAGGIAPRILPGLAAGGFVAAFNAKGAQSTLTKKLPVHVVTDETLGAIGAALLARMPA